MKRPNCITRVYSDLKKKMYKNLGRVQIRLIPDVCRLRPPMKGGRRSVGGEAVKYRSSKKKLMGGKVGGPYTWTKWQLETFVKPDIQYRAVKYRGN